MALQIHLLDYGDIELETSFLVLGHECGRVRRVPVYGFLITGGEYPVLVDTGYRDNAIMESLGMRGLQFHDNRVENQLARHGLRLGDIRYILHTHLHIDHAGQDDRFPMNTTVVLNRREMEFSVSGIISRGGTILRTFRYPEFATPEGTKPVAQTLKRMKLDGMIIIGGDGSFRGAQKLEAKFGLPVIGIPATIDNDIPGTDVSIGFDTALNIAIDAVDKVRDTATSHGRIFVIEVMGREYGLLAAQVAIATGAEEVLLPEIPYNLDDLARRITQGYDRGKQHAIIIVAEGAGKASYVTFEIKERIQRGVRMVVLGHIQRGGSPSGYDRILASRLGHHATQLLLDGQHGLMVGLVANKIKTSTLEKNTKISARAVLRDSRLMEALV